MSESLMNLDTEILLFINGLHTPWLDKLMYFVSGRFEWIPLYVAILGFLVFKYKKQSVFIIFTIILLITISDQLSTAFKFWMERLRPCQEIGLRDALHLVHGRCGGKYGYVSSHASNVFALAWFTTRFIKAKWYCWLIFCWATIIAVSRVYLAKHYPTDVLRGVMLGLLLAYALWHFYLWSRQKLVKSS